MKCYRASMLLCNMLAVVLMLASCGAPAQPLGTPENTPGEPNTSETAVGAAATETTTTVEETTTSATDPTTGTTPPTTTTTSVPTTSTDTSDLDLLYLPPYYQIAPDGLEPASNKQQLKLRYIDEEAVLSFYQVYFTDQYNPGVSVQGSESDGIYDTEKDTLYWAYQGKTPSGLTVLCLVETRSERITLIRNNDRSGYENYCFVTEDEGRTAALAEIKRMGLSDENLQRVMSMNSHLALIRSSFATARVALPAITEEATGEYIEMTMYDHNNKTYITQMCMRTYIDDGTFLPYCAYSDLPYLIPHWV